MLYSYIYHHPKVLAAEGLLVRLLRLSVEAWHKTGQSDDEIMRRFLTMTDTALDTSDFTDMSYSFLAEYRYRVQNRLLPRVIFSIGGTLSHAEGDLVRAYLTSLQDKQRRPYLIAAFETSIGEELLKIDSDLASTPQAALYKTGTWVDAPKTPEIEDAEAIIGKAPATVSINRVFPIGHWTEAYKAHRYYVRIFAFSEYADKVERAARSAIESVIGIKSNDFFESARKMRIVSPAIKS